MLTRRGIKSCIENKSIVGTMLPTLVFGEKYIYYSTAAILNLEPVNIEQHIGQIINIQQMPQLQIACDGLKLNKQTYSLLKSTLHQLWQGKNTPIKLEI